jgi:hypothetical protein
LAYGAAVATAGRSGGRRAAGAGGRRRGAADRGPSYESAPSRNEQVLFVLSLLGLLVAAASVVAWAIHT